jgi:BRCA1-associated protein
MGTGSREGGLGPSTSDALSAEKIEAIGIEYSYLLTSQLDSQRSYYEEHTQELKSQVNDLKLTVDRLSLDLQSDRNSAAAREKERLREEEAKIAEVVKDKTKAEQRVQKVSEIARKLDKELKEERAVSEGLLRNLGAMKEKVELTQKEKTGLTTKIGEMEDQLRDVMFFLEAKSKIEQGDGVEAEAAGGSLEVRVPPTSSTKKKKSKK